MWSRICWFCKRRGKLPSSGAPGNSFHNWSSRFCDRIHQARGKRIRRLRRMENLEATFSLLGRVRIRAKIFSAYCLAFTLRFGELTVPARKLLLWHRKSSPSCCELLSYACDRTMRLNRNTSDRVSLSLLLAGLLCNGNSPEKQKQSFFHDEPLKMGKNSQSRTKKNN